MGQAIIPENGKIIELAKEGIASYMGEVAMPSFVSWGVLSGA